MTAILRLADVLVRLSRWAGADSSYTVTGRGSLFLNDALEKATDIRTFFSLHEQSAGFSACGEMSTTGNPVLCVVSTGSGATNIVTPLLTAFQDYLPLIVLSGQNTSTATSRLKNRRGRSFGEQEADIGNIVESLCERFIFVDDPEAKLDEIVQSFVRLKRTRSGPLWVDVPLDFQSRPICSEEDLVSNWNSQVEQSDNSASNQAAPTILADLNSQDKDPINKSVILLGQGVHRLLTDKQLEAVLASGIPLVTDQSVCGVVSSECSSYLGTIGAQAFEQTAFEALAQASKIYLIGVLPRSSLWGHSWSKFFPCAEKIALVSQLQDEDYSFYADSTHVIDGSISSEILNFILDSSLTYDSAQWNLDVLASQRTMQRIESLGRVRGNDGEAYDLRDLARSVKDVFPARCNIVVDSGYADLIFSGYGHLGPRQTITRPVSQGAMGYALAAAIGVASADPGTPVVAMVGDGSFWMNAQDFFHIWNSGFDIRVLILDNGGYGIIEKRQRTQFRRRLSGVGGSSGLRLPSLDELTSGIIFAESFECFEQSISKPGPSCIVIDTLSSQPYVQPIRSRDGGFEYSDLFADQ